jgi:hypothetical protein
MALLLLLPHDSAAAMEHSGEMERTSQLYGEVMACTYEDVQVMWSMLDKARICSAAAAAS